MSLILLDTHAFIWFSFDAPQLSTTAKQCIENDQNEVFVRKASIWESVIKAGLGKLTIGPDV